MRLDVRAAPRLSELCRPRAMNSAVTISNAVAKGSILGFFVQHSVGTPSLRPKRLASAFYLNEPILSGHANGSYGGAGTEAAKKARPESNQCCT